MNSRAKGARGERQWRDELRANGYTARRGQQFSGSPDSPDVVCDELAWAHFEVKAVERLNIYDAMEQATRDAGQQNTPFVCHKRNFRPFLVTMTAEVFFQLLRGDLPPPVVNSAAEVDSLAPARSALGGPSPRANSFRRFPSDKSLRGVLPPESANQTNNQPKKEPTT